MKNCPNCGSPIDPYRVKCEYCETMYFDWATWMQDGQPCFINYGLNCGDKKASIITQAIPHLKVVEVNNDDVYMMDKHGQAIQVACTDKYCDLHVVFTCVADQRDKSLFKMVVHE